MCDLMGIMRYNQKSKINSKSTGSAIRRYFYHVINCNIIHIFTLTSVDVPLAATSIQAQLGCISQRYDASFSKRVKYISVTIRDELNQKKKLLLELVKGQRALLKNLVLNFKENLENTSTPTCEER